MLIGYARVSTDDQDLALQRAALKEAGCRRVYEEKVSGARRDRPQLARLLDQMREDDVVVVYRLDRLARSTRDLLEIAEQLRDAGAGLRSLGEPWADTTSPAGRMVLTVFAGIAEFERALIQERTGAGRAAAMRRGVRFGRPAKFAAVPSANGTQARGPRSTIGSPQRRQARPVNSAASSALCSRRAARKVGRGLAVGLDARGCCPRRPSSRRRPWQQRARRARSKQHLVRLAGRLGYRLGVPGVPGVAGVFAGRFLICPPSMALRQILAAG